MWSDGCGRRSGSLSEHKVSFLCSSHVHKVCVFDFVDKEDDLEVILAVRPTGYLNKFWHLISCFLANS